MGATTIDWKLNRAAESLSKVDRSLVVSAPATMASDDERSIRRFVRATVTSPSMRGYFGAATPKTCSRALKFIVEAARDENLGTFLRDAHPTELGAAVRLVTVAVTAEPVCKFAHSPYVSQRKRALQFVGDGLRVITADLSDQPEPGLSTAKVAERVGRSVNTVKAWVDRGWFPSAHTTAGGHWRIPEVDVEAFLRRREAAARWERSEEFELPRGPEETDF